MANPDAPRFPTKFTRRVFNAKLAGPLLAVATVAIACQPRESDAAKTVTALVKELEEPRVADAPPAATPIPFQTPEKINATMAPSPTFPKPAEAPKAQIIPPVISVDLGDPASEASHNLKGWGGAQGAKENPHPSPSGDSSKRFQLLRSDNSLELDGSVPSQGYNLVTEVEDGGCDDSFQIIVNGEPVYQYQSRRTGREVIQHKVNIPPKTIKQSKTIVNFRNSATDSCGAAAVYNVRLEPKR